MSELYLYACKLTGNVLSDEQKRAGQRVGAYLAGQKISIDRVLYQNTDVYEAVAHKLVKAMGKGTHQTKRVEMGNWQEFNQAITSMASVEASEHGVLVIVPHDHLDVWAAGAPVENLSVLQKDILMRLECSESSGTSGKWSTQFFMACEALPVLFPFPFPDGPQHRPRPAYYYTQSAVIPFKKTVDGLRVLIIGSSKRKHFVVPKGIHEPGLSAQDSAAKESLEEAGVMGQVSERPIGRYSYPKWGAECTVTVYVQQVDELLSESQWQERHRGRQWMAPEQAAAVVKQPELGQMIKRLEPFLREELK
nr:NUDIX hydrolase [uncultured Desulfobacter sp.]